MPIFVDLNKKDIKKLFLLSKKKLAFKNMDSLARYFGISRSMLYKYMTDSYMLPKTIFLKLKKITNTQNLKCKEVEINKYCANNVKIPKINEDLLEIIGALNGDGHVSKNMSTISVTGGIGLDDEYLDYLSKKLYNLFKLPFKFSKHKNFIRIQGYSNNLILFLVDNFNVPIGSKIGKLKLPFITKSSKKLFLAYIRGLYDTDGTIYVRRKKDPVVEISSSDVKYLDSVKERLNQLGFPFGRGFNKIYLYDKKSIKRFFEEVKPANPKHLNRYKKYLPFMRR